MPATNAPEIIPSGAVLVPFEGEGSGISDLTWGQREILRGVRVQGRWMPIGGATALPPGVSVDDITASVKFILRRHQSLRTRLVFDAQGGVRQAVAASGELTIELYEAAPDEDAKQLADAVSRRFSEADFDEQRDWPVRVGTVSRNGAVEYAVFVYNHMMVDGMALSALLRDLSTMDPVTGDAPATTALQPLELVERQRSAAARRQHEASMRHWESVARAVPDRESAAADPQDPPYLEMCFQSPAGLPAMRAVAARCGTETGPVLLAANAVALGRVTGISPVVLVTIVNNRFRPGLADAVLQAAQRSPCLLDVEGVPFEQVVAQARQVSLRAGLFGYFDAGECDRMLERVARERGERVDLSLYYNDRRTLAYQEPNPGAASEQDGGPAPEELGSLIDSLLPQTAVHWCERQPERDNKFFVHINDSPDALSLLICADSRFLGPAGLERVAREIEAVLVRAATATATAAAIGSA